MHSTGILFPEIIHPAGGTEVLCCVSTGSRRAWQPPRLLHSMCKGDGWLLKRGILSYGCAIRVRDVLRACRLACMQAGKSSGPSEQRDSPGADAKSHVVDMLPPPQPLAVDEGGEKEAADLAASRSQAAALRQKLSEAKVDLAAAAAAQQATELSAANSRRQLSDIQDLTKQLYCDIQDLKRERQAAHDRQENLCKQLQSAQAELAGCRAAAGNRADASGAKLAASVAALQKEHARAMAAACDELVACRSAGMKVRTTIRLHEGCRQVRSPLY